MTFLWLSETGKVTRFTPAAPRPVRYYMRHDHFCQTCGAEWLGRAPKPSMLKQRLAWTAFGILVGLSWGWALWGVVWS